MVTEILWHLFNLEKQAARAGGMVHLLLGNHEGMLFSGDRRYLNEKYILTEKLMNTRYIDLYGENSVLGKWLRSKPVMISIDDLLFLVLFFTFVIYSITYKTWGNHEKNKDKNESLKIVDHMTIAEYGKLNVIPSPALAKIFNLKQLADTNTCSDNYGYDKASLTKKTKVELAE